MIAQGFGFKEQARARHTGEKCGLARILSDRITGSDFWMSIIAVLQEWSAWMCRTFFQDAA